MDKINKILIIRLSSLGDIVLTTPIVRALRTKFPSANIYYLTKAAYKKLLNDNPYINEIISIETQKGLKGIYNLFKILRILRKMDFDLIIDLHFKHWSYFSTTLWNFLICNLMRARIKIKCERSTFEYAVNSTQPKGHVIDFWFHSLKKLELSTDNMLPELFINFSDKKWVDRYFNFFGVTENDLLIGICPGASWQSKQWGIENLRGVCNKLYKDAKFKFVFFGKKSERDLIEEICKDLGSDKLIYAIDISLNKIGCLINKCKVVLTNDSGLMHIASALGVPVVAIFGPTHPKLGYYPLGENNTILCSNIPCSPCSRWGKEKCRYKRQLCFENTGIESVVEALYKAVNIGYNANHAIHFNKYKYEYRENLSYL